MTCSHSPHSSSAAIGSCDGTYLCSKLQGQLQSPFSGFIMLSCMINGEEEGPEHLASMEMQ